MPTGQTPAACQEFQGKIEPMGPGGAWTCLRIPFNVEEVFGSKARVSVKGTINGFDFRSSIFPMGDGTHFMMVNKTMQKGANIKSGDAVQVVLEKDTVPRSLQVPKDIKDALAENGEAKTCFEKMSYSHKKEYVDWIDSSKQEETRARRIEKALTMLATGKRLKG